MGNLEAHRFWPLGLGGWAGGSVATVACLQRNVPEEEMGERDGGARLGEVGWAVMLCTCSSAAASRW